MRKLNLSKEFSLAVAIIFILLWGVVVAYVSVDMESRLTLVLKENTYLYMQNIVLVRAVKKLSIEAIAYKDLQEQLLKTLSDSNRTMLAVLRKDTIGD